MPNATPPRPALAQPEFLPASAAEMAALGWDELDVLLLSGDAHLDHPANGVALLGRWLVAHGYRTGVVAQPRWDGPADLLVMGRPRLWVGISAGSLDSMLAHYTAFGMPRSDDAYTPGGRAGARPDRAAIVYANLARQAFPGLKVVLGGIEASLRRAVHYDFWQNRLRRSVLLDAKADLILYGMAERGVLAVSDMLADGRWEPRELPGAVFAGQMSAEPPAEQVVALPTLEAIQAEPARLVEASLALEDQVHRGLWARQDHAGRPVWFTPPAPALTTGELDALYDLPFTRRAHPIHDQPVPAQEMLAASLVSHRGCGGGCSFCSLALHQGRRVASRSAHSILAEAARLARDQAVRGSISDLGGPSANMWNAACRLPRDKTCRRASCMQPAICPHFAMDQGAWLDLLDQVAAVPGIKHLRVASGLRFDLALADPAALARLIHQYVGGQLKVAPEHQDPAVLKLMRKPGPEVFQRFLEVFQRESRRAGKEQYLIPYLMSGFPGCGRAEMTRLGQWLAERGWRPQQVQCFVPTPGTVATAMFFAGVDPAGNAIPVARDQAQRRAQHQILFGAPAAPPAGGRRAPRDQAAGRPAGRSGERRGQRDDRREPAGGQDRDRRSGRQDRDGGAGRPGRPRRPRGRG